MKFIDISQTTGYFESGTLVRKIALQNNLDSYDTLHLPEPHVTVSEHPGIHSTIVPKSFTYSFIESNILCDS
jgi:hypothetical protein